MNDSTTRKTLSLKKKAAATPARTGPDEEPRKRSGARARQAALREHARQTRPEAEAGAEPEVRRPDRPEGPRKPRADGDARRIAASSSP